MIKRSSSKQQTQDQFLSYYVINRVLISKDVFSNTHVNHTWNFCFLGQWLCPNFRPHCFYKNKNTKRKKPHFRLTCVAQKCLCLRSLLWDNNIDKTERCKPMSILYNTDSLSLKCSKIYWNSQLKGVRIQESGKCLLVESRFPLMNSSSIDKSTTWKPESTAWNPEYKTILDSFTWGENWSEIGL